MQILSGRQARSRRQINGPTEMGKLRGLVTNCGVCERETERDTHRYRETERLIER